MMLLDHIAPYKVRPEPSGPSPSSDQSRIRFQFLRQQFSRGVIRVEVKSVDEFRAIRDLINDMSGNRKYLRHNAEWTSVNRLDSQNRENYAA